MAFHQPGSSASLDLRRKSFRNEGAEVEGGISEGSAVERRRSSRGGGRVGRNSMRGGRALVGGARGGGGAGHVGLAVGGGKAGRGWSVHEEVEKEKKLQNAPELAPTVATKTNAEFAKEAEQGEKGPSVATKSPSNDIDETTLSFRLDDGLGIKLASNGGLVVTGLDVSGQAVARGVLPGWQLTAVSGDKISTQAELAQAFADAQVAGNDSVGITFRKLDAYGYFSRTFRLGEGLGLLLAPSRGAAELVVTGVKPGGQAAGANVETGSLVVKVGGQVVATQEEFVRVVEAIKADVLKAHGDVSEASFSVVFRGEGSGRDASSSVLTAGAPAESESHHDANVEDAPSTEHEGAMRRWNESHHPTWYDHQAVASLGTHPNGSDHKIRWARKSTAPLPKAVQPELVIPADILTAPRPVLFCGAQVETLSDIDHSTGTFACKASFYFYWLDPANVGKPVGSIVDGSCEDSWLPSFQFDNLDGNMSRGGREDEPCITDSASGETRFIIRTNSQRQRFTATLNLHPFPFDFQLLDVRVRVHRATDTCQIERFPMDASGSSVSFSETVRSLEWNFHRAEIFLEYVAMPSYTGETVNMPQFRLTIPISRAWERYVLRFMATLFVLTSCLIPVLFASGKPVTGVLEVVIILLLTVVAMKFAKAEGGPELPFITRLDKYNYGCMSFFALAVIFCAIEEFHGGLKSNTLSWVWLCLWLCFNVANLFCVRRALAHTKSIGRRKIDARSERTSSWSSSRGTPVDSTHTAAK